VAIGLAAGLSSCGDDAVASQQSLSGQVWVDRVVSQAQALIEASRGQRFLSPVHGVWIRSGGYDSLVAALSAQYDLAGGDPSWTMTERTMIALGMVDSAGQWSKAQRGFDASSILGFYLPLTKTLYVFDSKDEQELYHTVVHETVHALQDQRFDLNAVDARSREADEGNAVTSLIEGEAEYVTYSVMLDNPGPKLLKDSLDAYRPSVDRLAQAYGDLAKSKGMPLSMVLPEMMPYELGPRFVSEHRSGGGWSEVDSLFRSPVKTTRSVMRPEMRDTLIDWNPGGCPSVSGNWRPLQTGRVGAILLASLLYSWIPPTATLEGMVAAWGGDRFWTFESDAGLGLLWRTSWSDTSQARNFADGWWASRAARRASAGMAALDMGSSQVREARNASGSRAVRCEVRGSDVVIAEGFGSAENDSLAAKLFDLAKRSEFAGRSSGTGFGGGEWLPPRPVIPIPHPRPLGR